MDQKSAIEVGRKFLLLLLQHEYPVKQMYLYGSYARGNHHKDSDIDLAIILKELPDPFQTQVNLLKISWKLRFYRSAMRGGLLDLSGEGWWQKSTQLFYKKCPAYRGLRKAPTLCRVGRATL
jgi:predicted nucleotidyltransferase